jgi:predicted ATPase
MEPMLNRHETVTGPWDEEHVKALLHFPRFPVRLIQQEPYQSWIGEHGGLKAIHDFLHDYPFPPSHRRILDVVLSNPEAVADVYADRLNISRATYFYQLRELVTAIFQSLNQWEVQSTLKPTSYTSFRSNLPAPLTNLVGVEATLNTLLRLFSHEDVRLLTLLGPGGIGKTRLSVEVARKMECDACFVDLSTLRDPSRVGTYIANALGILNGNIATIKSTLRDHDFLLILDNFEQIYPARSLVTELLAGLPQLKIIVTSRSSLNIYGEHEFVVPPLAITSIDIIKDQQLWAQSPAVSLFVQRAQTISPNFSLNNENIEEITELCQRLEGLPLAIELAAYQIKYLSPRAMLSRLQNNLLKFFDQNVKCMPPQQQTLRAAFDWSFDLLPPDVQVLFDRLSSLKSTFTLEEAQSLYPGIDLQPKLVMLVNHSLLEQHVGPNGESRFQMLDMAREYAHERLSKQPTS